MADKNFVYYGNYNPAKVIELNVKDTDRSPSNGEASDYFKSWRCNISRLLSFTKSLNTNEAESADFKGFFDSEFYLDTNVNTKVQLLLEDPIPDVALSTSNKPNYPIGGVIDGAVNTGKSAIKGLLGAVGISGDATNTLLNLGTLAANAVSASTDEAGGTGFIFNPWIKNAPAWQGVGETTPLTFDYTFKFRLGQYRLWNAKEEVVKPIANLIIPTMLRKIGSVRMFGPFPTPGALLAKIGEDVINGSAFGDKDTADQIDSKLEKLALGITEAVESGYDDYLYTLSIGPLNYDWVTIMNSKVEWSPETDQYGFPIAGSATLTFNVPFPAALQYGDSVPNTVSMKFKPGSF